MKENMTKKSFKIGGIPIIETLPKDKDISNTSMVMLMHGSASSKDEVGGMFEELTSELVKKGLGTIRFDFAGGGERATEPVESYYQHLDDAEKVFKYVKDEVKPQNIIVLGYSLGARFAVELVNAHPDEIQSTVLWSGAVRDGRVDFEDFFGENDEDYKTAQKEGEFAMPLDFRDEPYILKKAFFDELIDSKVEDKFYKYDGDVLVICGTEDTEIPPEALKDFCGKCKNAKFVSVEGADHIYNVFEENGGQSKELIDTTAKFVEDRVKNTIDIAKLGAQIGMEAKEQKLPNGKVVKSLVWNQENLLKAVEAVKHLSEEGKPVIINGAAPAWLVSALCHTVHPCPVSVYVPQIGKNVDIPQLAHGEANPEGEVTFKTTEKGDSILIEYNMDLPAGIITYNEENLSKVVVPEVPQGKAVYLSGRGPNYLTTAIAEAYAHTNSSVSIFQPGIGYTCSITHSRSKKLGDLTKDPLGKEEIKEQLATSKEETAKEQLKQGNKQH